MPKRSLFILAFGVSFAALPAAADSIFTLGVHRGWDWNETLEHFLEAGITFKQEGAAFSDREVDGVIHRTIAGLEAMVKLEGAKNPWSSALSDIDLAEMDFGELRANLDCTYWENGIEQRDDLAFVAVCFSHASGYETIDAYGFRQTMVVPFFRSDQAARSTVQGYLTEAYGEPLADVPDWWVAEFMGTLPVKYIFVPDLPDGFKEEYAVSAMAVYFDAKALEEIHSDQEDVKEKREADAEQAKKDARKGL